MLPRGERFFRLSPFAVPSLGGMALAHIQAGDDARAIFIARRGLQITRKYGTFYSAIAAAAAHLGRMDEAGAAMAELLSLREDYSIARQRAASGYADTPGTRRLLEGLSLAGLPEGEA